MTDTLQFKQRAPEPDAQCVELLEDLLERAKSGQIRGFLFVAENAGGDYIRARAGTRTVLGAIGAAELLKARAVEMAFGEE